MPTYPLNTPAGSPLTNAKRLFNLKVADHLRTRFDVLYGQDADGHSMAFFWYSPGSTGQAAITLASPLRALMEDMGAHPQTQYWYCYRPLKQEQRAGVSMYQVVFGDAYNCRSGTVTLAEFCRYTDLDECDMLRNVLHRPAMYALAHKLHLGQLYTRAKCLFAPTTVSGRRQSDAGRKKQALV